MGASRWTAGALAVVVVAVVVWGARRLRRSPLPGWSGAPASAIGVESFFVGICAPPRAWVDEQAATEVVSGGGGHV